MPPPKPEPSTRARLSRLCKAGDAELAVSLATYGIHPSQYGLPCALPAPPAIVLDDLFAGLSIPARAPKRTPPPSRAPSNLEAHPQYPDLVRAVLSHPPSVFHAPAPPKASPPPPAAPQPRGVQQAQTAAPLAHQQPQQAPAAPYKPLQQAPATIAQYFPPSNQKPPNVSAEAPRRAPHPRGAGRMPPSRDPPRQDSGVIDLDSDGDVDMDEAINFEEALAQEASVRAQQHDGGRKRTDRASNAGRGGNGRMSQPQPQAESPRNRNGAYVISDDEDDDEGARGGHGRKRGRGMSKVDRELNRTLANNPYCAGFQQQQQQRRNDVENEGGVQNAGDFRTAKDKYEADLRAKGKRPRAGGNSDGGRGAGSGRQGGSGEDRQNDDSDAAHLVSKAVIGRRPRFSGPRKTGAGAAKAPAGGGGGDSKGKDETSALREALLGAVLTDKPNVKWADVAGLDAAKEALHEAVILPKKFPGIFTGMRKPWKGVLLYGPPGTGKSFLAKAVATEAESFFISVSSSDLVSKWQGESERLVKELFVLAGENTPTVIFIDEIDSLVSSRSETESESSRRIKTEFLVQMDGVGNGTDGILVLGATNIPWGLDDALLRRMERRVYIPLPDVAARARMFELNVGETPHELCEEDFEDLARLSDGFSGSDLNILAKDAVMQPVRASTKASHFKRVEIEGVQKFTPCSPDDSQAEKFRFMDLKQHEFHLPLVAKSHFLTALKTCKPSVGQDTLQKFKEFTKSKGQEGG